MMREVHRVTKPGGMFLGTIATIEPFDGHSLSSFTRLGIALLLQDAGFTVNNVASDPWWTGLVALSKMGLFPKMSLPLIKACVTPLDALSKVWWGVGAWKRGDHGKMERLTRTTGAHEFIAVRDPEP
jgi:hypothetical protein